MAPRIIERTIRTIRGAATAMTAGIQAARDTYDQSQGPNPLPATDSQFDQQASLYDLYRAYYDGSLFDRGASFANAYLIKKYGLQPDGTGDYRVWLSRQGLYRHIRLIYNPTRRLVRYYGNAIYPGSLSEDGANLPDGYPIAIPFPKDMDKRLKDAIAQFWQWSNYQSFKNRYVRTTAIYGSNLIEIVDDVERGKIGVAEINPAYVKGLILDNSGNIKAYAIEYLVEERGLDGRLSASYRFRKEVDKQEFRYYRDGQPYDFNGNGAAQPNVYGFCPAVWVKHTDNGGLFGEPVIAGSLIKINEINNLASLVHDQINKKVKSPFVFWANGTLKNLLDATQPKSNSGQPEPDDVDDPNVDRDSVALIKGPMGGRVDSLASDLNLADSAGYMDRQLAEIEADHPELSMYQKLRDMTNVTGPGANRMVGDVAGMVQEGQSNHDGPNISLFRMAVAIGGQNLKDGRGAWAQRTSQQLKFAGFDLSSFRSGNLDIVILPRPLFIPTKQEIAQEESTLWTGVSTAVGAGAPLEYALKSFGKDDTEIATLGASQDAELKRIQTKQQLAVQDTVPTQLPPGRQQ